MSMTIQSYPDCCGFKIAYELERLTDRDLKDIVDYTQRNDRLWDSKVNNRVLMAFTTDQLRTKRAHYKKYFAEHKRKFIRINYFVNPKTGNRIHLYVVHS